MNKHLNFRFSGSAAFLFFVFGGLLACNNSYTPKPRGYYRIVFPEKSYQPYASEYCPFTFEYPAYAQVERDTVFFDTIPDDPCWLNIKFPDFSGTVYLSYKELSEEQPLAGLIEDAHSMTFKHTIKAEFIDESVLFTPNDVHGLLYDVGGNAASSVQFFLTDSNRHFLRGSLYFRATPNADSLAPVVGFVRQDILHMINSLEWTNNRE